MQLSKARVQQYGADLYTAQLLCIFGIPAAASMQTAANAPALRRRPQLQLAPDVHAHWASQHHCCCSSNLSRQVRPECPAACCADKMLTLAVQLRACVCQHCCCCCCGVQRWPLASQVCDSHSRPGLQECRGVSAAAAPGIPVSSSRPVPARQYRPAGSLWPSVLLPSKHATCCALCYALCCAARCCARHTCECALLPACSRCCCSQRVCCA